MRSDLTDVTLIIDRSGSMVSCKTDAEGGVNSFVEDQKKQAGECVFTLIQFDTDYEFVCKAVPMANVPKYSLIPRGWTALLDAVGRGIVETGERLSAMDEKDKPGLVVFVIVTDGQENSSKEYTKDRIKKMIEEQQDVYKWQFTFLGANQDAFAEAGGMGIKMDSIASFSVTKSAEAFMGASCNVSRMRNASFCGTNVKNAYTDEEREEMTD